MKNIIKILLVVSLISMTVISVSSNEPYELYSLVVDNHEITIEHQGLSQTKLDMIVNDALGINSENGMTPYGLLCLFGHSISTGTRTDTSHSVYEAAPRCVEKKYNYEVCTRSGCDYYSSTLISTNSKYCH